MFDRLSLRYRIALIIFLMEACMLAAVLGITLSLSQRTAIEFDASGHQASLDLLADLSLTALLTSEYSDYQLYIDDIRKQPSLDRILLANSQGIVVAGSQVADVGQRLGVVVADRDPRWQVRSIDAAGGHMGTLAVLFSDRELAAAFARTRNTGLIVAVSGVLVIALVGLATGFALTRRLGIVTATIAGFATGDHSARSRVGGGDEVALLSRTFDHLADAVAEHQQRLKEQGEYITLLLESTEEGIYGADLDGICTLVNTSCLRMLGYAHHDDLVGKGIHALIHHTYPDGRTYPEEQCRIQLAMRQGQPAHGDDEVHWRADGSSFPVEYWSHPISRDGKLIGTVVAFIDITERKQLEEALLARQTELQGLYRSLQAIREEERYRLARELHDDLGQRVTALRMDLDWIDAKLPEDLPPLRKKMAGVAVEVDELADAIRRLTEDMRPGLLSTLGLVSAVRDYADKFSARTDIACELSTSHAELHVDDEIGINVFRLVQESLNNISKHASASRVVIALERDAAGLRLVVEDDGIGIVAAQSDERKGFGLVGMRERVSGLNGRFSIASESGRGVRIEAAIPLVPAPAVAAGTDMP